MVPCGDIGSVIREWVKRKECRVEEGHLMSDHVHMLMSIPPKHSVAQIVGFVKGKSAIHMLEVTWAKEGTSWEKIFRLVDSRYRLWVEMRSRSASTSRNKNKKTSESTNSRCSNNPPL